MTKKELHQLSEEDYCKKLDKKIHSLVDNFFEEDNDNDLPCIILIPHKYGIALSRRMPKCVKGLADGSGHITSSDLAYPLTNAFAHILDLVKCTDRLKGFGRFQQMTNDEVAYQIFTILLAEILAAGRVSDSLDLADCEGMQETIHEVKKMHGIEQDDEDDEDECDCDECEEVCVKKGNQTHHIRGMEMKLNDLEPHQILEIIALLANDDLSDKEKGLKLEKMIKKFGGKPVSKDKLKDFAKKLEEKDD